MAVSTLSCPGPDHASTGAPNLLDNPGFECALEGTWRTAFSVITRETSGARSGSGSLLLRPTAGTPSESLPPSAWSLTEVQVEQGGLYCADIWMQGEVVSGARIGLRKTDAFGAVSEDSLLGFPHRGLGAPAQRHLRPRRPGSPGQGGRQAPAARLLSQARGRRSG